MVQGPGLVQEIHAKLLRSFVSRPCGHSLILRFCWHQSKVHFMGEHVGCARNAMRRNFSVSTAFTTTEEGAESPSAGVTFIADHPLLFSVLVKHTARCKWKVLGGT